MPPDAPKEKAEPLTPAQVRAMIADALQEQQEAHDQETKSLKATVEALHKSMANTVPVIIPEHGAGPGTEIAPTWSQYEQTEAIYEAQG